MIARDAPHRRQRTFIRLVQRPLNVQLRVRCGAPSNYFRMLLDDIEEYGPRIDPKTERGCRINSRNGEMQQPSCFSEPTAVLFLLYRGEKGPKRGTLSVSWVFRGLRTSGQGAAPTPHHLLKKVDENFWDYLRQPRVSYGIYLPKQSASAAAVKSSPKNRSSTSASPYAGRSSAVRTSVKAADGASFTHPAYCPPR